MPPKGPTDIIVVPGAICWRIIGELTLTQTNYTTNKLIGRSVGIETVHVAPAIVYTSQVDKHTSIT